MTDAERQAAWDQMSADMVATAHADNNSSAIVALTIIAAIALAAWAIGIF